MVIRDTIINTKYNLFHLIYNRKVIKSIIAFYLFPVLSTSHAFTELSCIFNYTPSKKLVLSSRVVESRSYFVSRQSHNLTFSLFLSVSLST